MIKIVKLLYLCFDKDSEELINFSLFAISTLFENH